MIVDAVIGSYDRYEDELKMDNASRGYARVR